MTILGLKDEAEGSIFHIPEVIHLNKLFLTKASVIENLLRVSRISSPNQPSKF
jgi:hypothetical protein